MAAPAQDFYNAGRSQIVGRIAFGAAERVERQGVRGVGGTTGAQRGDEAALAPDTPRDGAARECDHCEDDGGGETAPGEHDGREGAVGWISQRRRDAP